MDKIIHKIKNSETVGMGTGKTIKRFIKYLSSADPLVKNPTYIPTSFDTETLLKSLGFKTQSLRCTESIDLYIDSADYVDKSYNLIKGYGGALFKEKIAMTMSSHSIILVDKEKMVDSFVQEANGNSGSNYVVPVEIDPSICTYFINRFKCELMMSMNMVGPAVTENGNYIVFVEIRKLRDIDVVGVLGDGFFEHKKFKHDVFVINEKF